MRKSVWLALFLGLLFGWAVTASAVQLAVHGEFGSKLQTTNTLGIIKQKGEHTFGVNNDGSAQRATQLSDLSDTNHSYVTTNDELGNEDLDDTWAELQYRLWTVATSDDGNVKGVWAMEYGTANFGGDALEFANDTKGQFEMRLAYVDFQLPYFQSENRLTVGLQEIDISKWLWAETAAGIRNYGSFDVGATKVAYQIGWARQSDSFPDDNNHSADADYWFAKVDFNLKDIAKVDNFDIGLFFVYASNKKENNQLIEKQPWWLGGEVQFVGFKGLEFEGTFIYEGGDAENDGDISAWFAAASVGYSWTEQFKTSFIFWYASGDDNLSDKDQDNYDAIETDTFGSVILFEDATFDDAYYASSNPYLNDLGFLMFRLRADYQATPKLTLALAGNYMMFDEDVQATINGKEIKDDSIGWEIDGYAKYELYPGLTVDLTAGCLFPDDALDAYAANGDADTMYRVSLGVTYSF